MKNFFMLLIAVVTYTAITFSQDIPSSIAPLYNGPNWGTITDSGITCTGGPGTSIIRDDNTYENGYRTVSTGDSTTFVQLMRLPSTPMNLTNFCVTFTALSPSGNLPVDIIIYDTLGSGGTQPGSVVYRSNNHVCNSVALYPAHSRYGFPITFNATMKAYYVGVRWNNNPILPFFISADENGTSGGPGWERMTTTYPPVWVNVLTGFANFKNFGIRLEGSPASSSTFPDMLYYKFENNPSSSTVLNCAVPFVGTGTAPLGAGTPLSSGGQYDSCITGTGLTTGGITTGWNCNLGSSSWTLSMWVTIPSTSSGTAYYMFGDAGSSSFRCFHNGVAGQDNLVLRGGGMSDLNVTGIGPAPTVVTFVYDSTAGQVKAYKNGVLANTVSATLNMPMGSGFKVGGYGASPSIYGKMDEFRMWRRALSPSEVAALWNSDLGGCGITGISETGNEIPQKFTLSQNYPNPFNPSTTIKYSLPKGENVKLVVYDALGREVKTLVNEFKNSGVYSVNFDASSLSSGIYFYKIEAGSFTETKKMLLVK